MSTNFKLIFTKILNLIKTLKSEISIRLEGSLNQYGEVTKFKRKYKKSFSNMKNIMYKVHKSNLN